MQAATVECADDPLHGDALALPVQTHAVPERPHFGLGGQVRVGKEQLLHAERFAVVDQRVERLRIKNRSNAKKKKTLRRLMTEKWSGEQIKKLAHLCNELSLAEMMQPIEKCDACKSLFVRVALPALQVPAQTAASAVMHFDTHRPVRNQEDEMYQRVKSEKAEMMKENNS